MFLSPSFLPADSALKDYVVLGLFFVVNFQIGQFFYLIDVAGSVLVPGFANPETIAGKPDLEYSNICFLNFLCM